MTPMPDGLFLIPTRDRHDQAAAMIANTQDTARGWTRIIVVADEDDEDTNFGADTIWGPNEPLSPKINRWAISAAKVYPVVGWLADDCETGIGWDVAYYEALAAGPGIAFPATSNRTDGAAEHQAISSVIIRALGWYMYPGCAHYYTDTILWDLARGVPCARPSAAIVRHHHNPVASKIYADRHGPADGAAYREWRDGDGYPLAVATIRAALDAIAEDHR